MTRAQAAQIIQGYLARCDSKLLNGDWIDMADGPCRSFLFLNRHYCSESAEAIRRIFSNEDVCSCFGMSELVNEGENLADYMQFMISAIDHPGGVDAEINELKDRFWKNGDANSQFEVAKDLINDPTSGGRSLATDAEDFARLLLNSAACAGHRGAVNLASGKEWDLDLNDLETLSDSTAEVLSKHRGDLYLERLDELSDAAAAALAKHEGALMLGGVTKLSEAGAKALAKHPNLVVNEDVEALISKYRK